MAKSIKSFLLLGMISLFFLGGFQAQENRRDYPRFTGYTPLTDKQLEEIKKNKPHIDKVNLNWLGLDRVNEVRAKRGKPLLSADVTRPVAKEVDSSIGLIENTVQADKASEWAADLPASVDNSALKYFPPIRTQGSLNSCAVFSSVYYQLSYMRAFQLDLDIRDDNDNSNKLSPKFNKRVFIASRS